MRLSGLLHDKGELQFIQTLKRSWCGKRELYPLLLRHRRTDGGGGVKHSKELKKLHLAFSKIQDIYQNIWQCLVSTVYSFPTRRWNQVAKDCLLQSEAKYGPFTLKNSNTVIKAGSGVEAADEGGRQCKGSFEQKYTHTLGVRTLQNKTIFNH